MRHLALLVPSLAMVLLTPRAPESVSPDRLTPSSARASRVSAPNPNWMAEVNARIRDGSHQFFVHPGELRAEVPERGVTARFDDGGAHIANDAAAPVTVRTTRLGRAGSSYAIVATAPGLGDCQDGKVDPEGHCIPRLEYAGGGLTEWWEGGTAGFEQGWVLAERPEGDGPVQIGVEVGRADATVDGVVVKLRGDDGSTLLVSGLKAWDARGDDVPARFERAEDGFRVVVDDAGAVYPVEVDPVYTSADWIVEGQSDWDFGASVANAGDVNADGYDDVIVGAPGYLSSTGEALIYHGSSAGLASSASSTLVGAAPGDSFGYSVAGAGDTNGDGYDDVIVGAPEWDWHGGVYTYAGSATGVVPIVATLISGITEWSDLGAVVSGIGDVNNDGYADVAALASAGAEGVLIYRGSASGTSPTATQYLDPNYPNSVAPAGDVNGDGYDDLIIGCEGYSSDVGHAYVYNGSSSGIAGAASRTLTGENSGDYFGHAVAGVGDVDGDGYDDVVVSAGAWYTGRIYVYHGAPTGLSSSVRTIIDGPDWEFGYSVGRAGDVNQDGYDDILVGTGGDANAVHGVFVYPGSPSGVTAAATTTIPLDDWYYITIAAGDFNGDGRQDFLAGDSSYNSGAGRVSAWYGCVNSDHDAACEADDCDDTDPAITVPYADADGDGYGDAAAPADTCEAEVGFVWDGSDCDDTSAAIHPGAIEICDDANTDEDCDGLADDDDSSVAGTTSAYADEDGDGSGGVAGWFCDGVATSGDCDDAEPASYPGATEVCDHLDNDCDGDIDGDAVDKTVWYPDADGDGFTDPEISAVHCSAPDGYTAESDQPDCDDADSDVHPGAVEILDDQIDQDCDGSDAGNYYQHKSGICGCATTAEPSSLALVLIGAAFVRRRR